MSNRRRIRHLRVLPSLHASRELSSRPGEDMVLDRNLPPAGAINGYVCSTCHKITMVEHVDKGITPMYMHCLATEDCEGSGQSLRYPNQDNVPERVRAAVKWEWYRPDRREFSSLTPSMKAHVRQGGLVLREKD